jgi:hypothetical protein
MCIQELGDDFDILSSPVPPVEVDVLLVRDSVLRRRHSFKSHMIMPTFRDVIGVRGRGTMSIAEFSQRILQAGGICVLFTGITNGGFLRNMGLGMSPLERVLLRPSETARRSTPMEPFPSLARFVDRHYTRPMSYVALSIGEGVDERVFAEDTDGQPYAIACQVFTSVPRPGFVVCLPDYGDEPSVLDDLLSTALPDVAPYLFPFRHDLRWLMEDSFRAPLVMELENQKTALLEEARRQAAQIDDRISMRSGKKRTCGTC